MLHFIYNPNAGINIAARKANILKKLYAVPNSKVWETTKPLEATYFTKKAIEEHAAKSDEFKTVCAPISVPLFDRMGDTIQILGMSKRQFIEMAIVEVLDRCDEIMNEVDVFESTRPEEEATK